MALYGSVNEVLAPVTAKTSFYMRLKRFSSCGLWTPPDAMIGYGTIVRERIAGLDTPKFRIETNNLMN